MVTEAQPVACESCQEGEIPSTEENGFLKRPSTTSSITRRGSRPEVPQSQSHISDRSVKDQKPQQIRTSSEDIRRTHQDTPPASPQTITTQHKDAISDHRRDSSFRKTYDENDKKRAIPCENCALTLPKKTNEEPTTPGVQGSPEKTNSPVLRTRKPYERIVSPPEEPSPPKSDTSDSGDSETAVRSTTGRLPKALRRPNSADSSAIFVTTLSHTHYLDYTSTKEPLAPTSFSIIRQSCLRTLSCETLPPSSSSSATSPSSPSIQSPFFAPTSSNSTSSGGPIFFGDPLAGYTTAYVFRIPDPSARGRRRVYALMALSTQRERLAMQSFSVLSTAFRELAAWIQGLAEQELERSENVLNSPRLDDDRSSGSTSFPELIPTSSFLSGRSRGSDGKFAGVSLKGRGLADLVGLPDFFIELHARFVRLLAELSVMFGA